MSFESQHQHKAARLQPTSLEGHNSHLELLINRIITTEVAQQRKNLDKPMKENQPLDEQLKAYHLVKDNPLD